MNVINESKRMASPNNISVIPKYIGWRLVRKGPSVTSEVGISYGIIVVLLFLNKESAHIAIISPRMIRIIPE
ncbi:MAG: hypothetical protein OIN86_17125 [Candidatus Methanoperedens sp.]|nr:hypothetical protein [Candidatus Methanoperedens sp.]